MTDPNRKAEKAQKAAESALRYLTEINGLEFKEWPKIGRLNRDIIITEKLDGTNAAIGIVPETLTVAGEGTDEPITVTTYRVYAQSRNRIITVGNDNYGFAAWVKQHADVLIKTLGPGLHFGEWWGCSIARNYGLSERRFSLFNTEKWDEGDGSLALSFARSNGVAIYAVPVLYKGPWTGLLGYKVNDESRPDHGQWMNLAEQTDWTDVEFAREIEAKIATINERIVEVTQHDLSDLVTGMIRDLVPVNPRPRYAPNFILEHLKRTGSQAVPGYMQPEGIVVYHRASDTCFKATIEGDESHKGQQG